MIAFSGGGDSMALLRGALDRGPAFAAIIDHGLHAHSAARADQAGALASDLGAEVLVHRLSWPDGPPRDQASARRARCAALGAIARACGATEIVTGHTSDDQAETVLIRLSAHSRRRGLAGMAPISPLPHWPDGHGLRLRRPLLGCTRAALRAFLRARGAAWMEDPANDDPHFARVRARRLLAAAPAFSSRLLQLAANAARRSARIDRATLALLQASVEFGPDGAALIVQNAYARADASIRNRLLEVVVPAVSGREDAPAPDKFRAMADRVRLGLAQGCTLGGVLFQDHGAMVRLTVDPGRLRGRKRGQAQSSPQPVALTQPVVWQGRVLITPALNGRANPLVESGRASPQDPDALLPAIRSGDRSFSLDDAIGHGLVSSWRVLAPERAAALLYRASFTLP
jgi:tRNA(Ile)-lysidine synthase